MHKKDVNQGSIKYLAPDNLHQQIHHFTKGMAVTKGSFELLVEQCTLADIEWNHMDQQHRPSIHNTYEKGIRIALGPDFAVSLTQWKNWPLFITVTDVYVDKGLFYQSLTIGGFIFLHSIISMEEAGDNIKLKDEWYIASHKLFKPLHSLLNKKLYKLNKRLQDEDAQIRQGRFVLRQLGYKFHSDPVDYHSSNIMGTNTIYPPLPEAATFSVQDCGPTLVKKSVGALEFLLKKQDQTYFVWPAICPHEGGPLEHGTQCDSQIVCPWHSLRFSAAQLSASSPRAQKYGFEYYLDGQTIQVKQTGNIQQPIATN